MDREDGEKVGDETMNDTMRVVRIDKLTVHDGVAYWADHESNLCRIGDVIELTEVFGRGPEFDNSTSGSRDEFTMPGGILTPHRRMVSEWEAIR